ncbi:hypothetical protein [Glutamicibacter soli]|nr:hypothetical protein [Glutamicibacter soli]
MGQKTMAFRFGELRVNPNVAAISGCDMIWVWPGPNYYNVRK